MASAAQFKSVVHGASSLSKQLFFDYGFFSAWLRERGDACTREDYLSLLAPLDYVNR
ncbi:hypothetical protein PanWU01x14_088740 [Parasponia andersonii]|uniref:Uncharacterized protein n=1 Tax=Parasponia andersonii TaxID=3476 RepID=A0A2P5D7Z8_PARAD|nr:hypothetical protein PanWU01x14_088740 [Parasponia andersonii]